MSGPVAPPRRWDPLVRLTHWGVAAAIVINGLLTEEGSPWHVWVGLAAGALLALRLAWGLIGPPEARFSAFPPSPAAAVGHVKDILAGRRTPHRSHNPLGALMVYAVWATLAVVVGTGVAMTGFPPAPRAHEAGEVANHPVADREAEAGEDEGRDGEDGGIGEIHEVAANLLFVLAAVHLAGVAFETRRSGRQVVTAMLGGKDTPKDA